MVRRNPSNDEHTALPTNIKNLTRQYVKDHIPEWDQKIKEQSASDLAQLNDEGTPIELRPLYLIEVERRAQMENRSVQDVLVEYTEQLHRSTYPGPNCFLPDELSEFIDTGLSEERLRHAKGCPSCATLLSMSRPLDDAAAALLSTISPGPEVPVDSFLFAPPSLTGWDKLTRAVESWGRRCFVACIRFARHLCIPVEAGPHRYSTDISA